MARVTLTSDGVAARVRYTLSSDTDTEARPPVVLGVYDESALEPDRDHDHFHDASSGFAVGTAVAVVGERETVRGWIARKDTRPSAAPYFVRYHNSPPSAHDTRAAGWHCAAELVREDWRPRLRVGARVRSVGTTALAGEECVIAADDGSTRPYHVRSARASAWLERSHVELVQETLRDGTRVVRGPAWDSGDRDGGIGSVGRVVSIGSDRVDVASANAEPARASASVARYAVRWANQAESAPSDTGATGPWTSVASTGAEQFAYDPANAGACEIVPLRE